ncbi:cytochrome P450 [Actinomadura madurae]|uniref:cytochrome P450 n=1 Tax=Actinomadura madurae TaxID=1993 RepID=UPI0039995AC1
MDDGKSAAFDPLAVAPVDVLRRGLAEQRASGCPVSHVAPGLGFVSRHEFARKALLDSDALSNEGNFVLEGDGDGPPPPSLITQSDPPEHTALRDLLRPGFARTPIAEATPWITERVHELVGALPDGGPADVVGDIALPLTATVIARLVGVPNEDADELARLSLAITAMLPASFVGSDEWRRLESYFTAAAVQRRAAAEQPDDLLTRLAAGRIDGRPLSDREVAFHAWQLFVAGLESTAYTIGSTVYQLLSVPDRWKALLADRSMLPDVREEGLRHGSAIRWVFRTVRRTADLGGEPLQAGDRMIIGLESANFDTAVFGPDADEFDPRRRTARRHMSFGHGIHLCLGAELARLEISATLEVLLDRLPGLRLLTPDAPYQEVQSPMFCGPQRLDVTW